MQETGAGALGWEIPWRWARQPTSVFLPEEAMDRGAWWATVRGVVKSQACLTQLNVQRPSANSVLALQVLSSTLP